MAGARIAGGDFFPAQQLAAAGGAALACQWSEPSLLHLTHSHIHLSILFSRPRTICEKIRLVNIWTWLHMLTSDPSCLMCTSSPILAKLRTGHVKFKLCLKNWDNAGKPNSPKAPLSMAETTTIINIGLSFEMLFNYAIVTSLCTFVPRIMIKWYTLRLLTSFLGKTPFYSENCLLGLPWPSLVLHNVMLNLSKS